MPRSAGSVQTDRPAGAPGLREFSLIAIEAPLVCGLPAARRIFEAPAGLLRLWPGVEDVRESATGFRLAQRIDLPFLGEQRHEFAAWRRDRAGDRRRRHALWETEGWVFRRAVLWKLSSTRRGLHLDFCSQHALTESQLVQAVNVYRSQSIWPMRHDADAILERLVLSFLYDRLVELDRAYVLRVKDWLDSES